MHVQLQDAAVQAAIIGGFFTLTSAVIGKRFDNQRKLKFLLDRAVRDLAFALAVEDEHCAMHVQERGESFKKRVRDKVRESGLEWSGDFTPGRARHMIARYAQRSNAE